jgi:chromatin segregation and condensation protein Rec8/ScpA/Scc1 (kleisin family)
MTRKERRAKTDARRRELAAVFMGWFTEELDNPDHKTTGDAIRALDKRIQLEMRRCPQEVSLTLSAARLAERHMVEVFDRLKKEGVLSDGKGGVSKDG